MPTRMEATARTCTKMTRKLTPNPDTKAFSSSGRAKSSASCIMLSARGGGVLVPLAIAPDVSRCRAWLRVSKVPKRTASELAPTP